MYLQLVGVSLYCMENRHVIYNPLQNYLQLNQRVCIREKTPFFRQLSFFKNDRGSMSALRAYLYQVHFVGQVQVLLDKHIDERASVRI